MRILKAEESDLNEILELQYLSYQSEAEIYQDYSIQPLKQTIEELKQEYLQQRFFKADADGRIVGSVRANEEGSTCFIGKLIVHPEYQNQGIGTKLMGEVEGTFGHCRRFELFTGNKSERNLYLYTKLGYEVFKSIEVNRDLTLIYLEKINQ